jgi:hypothetical protein
MAQGAIKKTPRPIPTKSRSSAKKANKVTKPKKAKATAAVDKLQRKFAGNMVAKTEQLLGERAGHLELIGKGKKGNTEKGLKHKGGTKKFG